MATTMTGSRARDILNELHYDAEQEQAAKGQKLEQKQEAGRWAALWDLVGTIAVLVVEGVVIAAVIGLTAGAGAAVLGGMALGWRAARGVEKAWKVTRILKAVSVGALKGVEYGLSIPLMPVKWAAFRILTWPFTTTIIPIRIVAWTSATYHFSRYASGMAKGVGEEILDWEKLGARFAEKGPETHAALTNATTEVMVGLDNAPGHELVNRESEAMKEKWSVQGVKDAAIGHIKKLTPEVARKYLAWRDESGDPDPEEALKVKLAFARACIEELKHDPDFMNAIGNRELTENDVFEFAIAFDAGLEFTACAFDRLSIATQKHAEALTAAQLTIANWAPDEWMERKRYFNERGFDTPQFLLEYERRLEWAPAPENADVRTLLGDIAKYMRPRDSDLHITPMEVGGS